MREKKNEFVFTIGFKKKDPEHVRVVKMLNEMGTINQFIVDAVLCYVDSGYMNVRPWNIKPAFIQPGQPGQPVAAQEPVFPADRGVPAKKVEEVLKEEDITGIMQTLRGFRKD